MIVIEAAIVHGAVVVGMHDLGAAIIDARLAHLRTEVANAATKVAAAAKVPEAAAKVAPAAKPTTETAAEVTATETAAARQGAGCQTKSAKRNRYGQCDS
jgi:hypothetical protein